jgi:uncharacterized protein YcbK (DUF882 family)
MDIALKSDERYVRKLKHVRAKILRKMKLTKKMSLQGRVQRLAAVFLAASGVTFAGVQSTQDAVAQGGTRSLTIHHAHTKEQQTITYKRYGSYDAEGMKQMNWMLRDWRQDAPTRMDPVLFDILWEIYRASGSSAPIHVVSAYRSPGTNAMLARRSRGVARNSQHMSGKAIDFNISDVSTAKLRDLGLRLQNGGVGYYPNANNPWVHIDTGGVRHWPKVSRDHLVRLFPDEKTVHIPNDGRPLAGFEAARSIIEARGGAVSSGYLEIASGRATGKTLFQILFGGGDSEEEEIVPKGARGRTAVAARQRANQRVASAPVSAAPDPSDGGSAIAFFNQSSNSTSVASRIETPARLETPAAQAAIRSRPARPTPIPEPKVEEKPVEAKTPEPAAPEKAIPAKQEAPKAIAVAALPTAQKSDAASEKGRWVTVALPQRRPANLAPSGPPLVTVALPPKRPDNLESLVAEANEAKPVESLKPVQVASVGKAVTIPLPVTRPSNLPSAEAVGLRTGSSAPTAAATAPSTALGYAPVQPMQKIIPASPSAASPAASSPAAASPAVASASAPATRPAAPAATAPATATPAATIPATSPPVADATKAKDKKSLDALMSQVAISASPNRGGPVAPASVASVANRSPLAGKFENKENPKAEANGFSGSAIRPLSNGFKAAQ